MMRGIPKNKRVLFDVGVAGPIAGLVIAVPVLFIGLSLSHLGPIGPAAQGASGFLEGNSLFYLFSKYVMFGKLLPEPVHMNGLPPVIYWMQYFLTGHPIPFNGMDVMLHNVALAGWAMSARSLWMTSPHLTESAVRLASSCYWFLFCCLPPSPW